MNLTNEQIARVFAMYVNGKCEKGHQPIKMIDPRGNKVIVTLYALSSDRQYLREAKLVLKPLSAINDEDALEVANFQGLLWHDQSEAIALGKKVAFYDRQSILHWNTYQYLVSKSYAVPLFIAPNHPDNGKDAIALGLAMDATTLQNQKS